MFPQRNLPCMGCNSVVHASHSLSPGFCPLHYIKLGVAMQTWNSSQEEAEEFRVLEYSKPKARLSCVSPCLRKKRARKGKGSRAIVPWVVVDVQHGQTRRDKARRIRSQSSSTAQQSGGQHRIDKAPGPPKQEVNEACLILWEENVRVNKEMANRHCSSSTGPGEGGEDQGEPSPPQSSIGTYGTCWS